jgi:DNA-binding transcriptional regulator YdaS (Cro superfamily)
MRFDLPVTNYSVELHDFVPQSVFEKYQEMIAKNIKFDMKDANVTIDRIAEVLGPDRAFAIQNADEGERQVLMNEARQEIIAQSIRAEINLADTHAADRQKCVGMIKDMRNTNGDSLTVSIVLGELPRRDYAVIQKEIAKIEAADDAELKKSPGQSDDSSSASQSTVRK